MKYFVLNYAPRFPILYFKWPRYARSGLAYFNWPRYARRGPVKIVTRAGPMQQTVLEND